jgi:hypothetical protein
MLRAIPACRAGDFTGCLADEIGCRGGIRTYISPLNRRPLDCLSYPAMVEAEGLAPPEWLDVSQLPWLLGDTSKLARPTGAAPAISCSTGRRLC